MTTERAEVGTERAAATHKRADTNHSEAPLNPPQNPSSDSATTTSTSSVRFARMCRPAESWSKLRRMSENVIAVTLGRMVFADSGHVPLGGIDAGEPTL
ncbi:hypothetical protein SAMN05661093_03777 [Kibdelosporangium aridum]|uniref:Uncharacterized protein n=1 Tax=Kibdelosporangium aridum TaxID=2030 RepID=A0A1W2DRZ6_KIBAR|nr:hypothetical protein SAMN05661093_03777 [Kibdelosporangium aridum]